MGGVDEHDRLVGQHPIPLRSKRGYLSLLSFVRDCPGNAWILFRTTIQARGEWNQAARRRYTLAKFKESVILSLCGRYTSLKLQASHTGNQPTLPSQSPSTADKNLLPDFSTEKGRCLIYKSSQRTACMACKQVYCYTCGRQHLHELLLQHATTSTLEAEGTNLPLSPELDTSILLTITRTTNVMSDNESSDSEQYSSSNDDDDDDM